MSKTEKAAQAWTEYYRRTRHDIVAIPQRHLEVFKDYICWRCRRFIHQELGVWKHEEEI